jgi:peptidoglycan/LPS O-acetylase OafA/YrhL
MPVLDGLRAFAILLVLFAHGSPWAKHIPFDAGSSGVQIFFVLSGFLITNRVVHVYTDVGSVCFGRFYYHRAFRILPLLLAYVLTLSVLIWVIPRFPASLAELGASLLFFRNYFLSPGWFTGHFWSLAVEEHYYLLWPLVLHLAGKRRAPWVAVAIAFLCVGWRATLSHYHVTLGHVPLYCRTDTRLDGLLIGSALALLLSEPSNLARIRRWIGPRDSFVFLALLLAVWVAGAWSEMGFRGIQETLVVAGLILSMVVHQNCAVSRFFSWAPLTWIGRLSYSLYIWQQLFLVPSSTGSPLGALNRFPLNFLCVFGVASLSYYCLEQPIRSFGVRIYNQIGLPDQFGKRPELLVRRIAQPLKKDGLRVGHNDAGIVHSSQRIAVIGFGAGTDGVRDNINLAPRGH